MKTDRHSDLIDTLYRKTVKVCEHAMTTPAKDLEVWEIGSRKSLFFCPACVRVIREQNEVPRVTEVVD